MDFLRMYLGEMTGIGLIVLTLFAASAIAMGYFAGQRMIIRIIRNVCVGLTLALFTLSLMRSLALNQPPRGRIDRTAVDQDQKAFELRHSN